MRRIAMLLVLLAVMPALASAAKFISDNAVPRAQSAPSDGDMVCSVKADCEAGETEMLRLSYPANAHAGTAGGSAYAYKVCCSETGNTCSGHYATALTLSGPDNAHVATDESYSTEVCVSASETVPECSYGDTCGTAYTCLATVSGGTNAHIADCDGVGDYATKVCCTACDWSVGTKDPDLDDLVNSDEPSVGTEPCDPDTDGDGPKDKPEDNFVGAQAGSAEDGEAVDYDDNCPTVANADQANNDGKRRPNGSQVEGEWASNPAQDKPGDVCDPDKDNDGLPDTSENDASCPFRMTGDSDGDTVLDGYEVAKGTDPCNPAGKPPYIPSSDTDSDGFTDRVEQAGYNTCASLNDTMPGWTACADPTDSDGDGCADWIEIVDVNGNRQAEILDVFLVTKRAFNQIPPSDSDTALDIDKNGSVNLLDGYLAAKNSNIVRTHSQCASEG